MSPVTHFLGSWLVATGTATNPRDRLLVTLAGVLPDADGLGIIADFTRSAVSGAANTFQYYQRYHHYLLHGWPGAIVITAFLTIFAKQPIRVALLCLLVFHLHLICDLIGSRGPSAADLWPISYGEPIFRHPVFFWKHQWRLDGWQNRIITLALFSWELAMAPVRGYSIVSIFSSKTDSVVVDVLQKWRHNLWSRKHGGNSRAGKIG